MNKLLLIVFKSELIELLIYLIGLIEYSGWLFFFFCLGFKKSLVSHFYQYYPESLACSHSEELGRFYLPFRRSLLSLISVFLPPLNVPARQAQSIEQGLQSQVPRSDSCYLNVNSLFLHL